MKNLATTKKMRLLEFLLCLLIIGELIASILFTFLYAPGFTTFDVKFGFRYGFIDYFKGSSWKIIVGIAAIIIVLTFSVYWILEIFSRKIQTLGPIYLIGLMVDLVFLNGYYNVVNRFEGLMAIDTLLAVTLLANCVYSFVCYIKYLEKNSADKE